MATTPVGGLVRSTDDVNFTGNLRVNGGSAFKIADPTDATKTVIFNLSGLTTGTETEFTVPESDAAIVTISAAQTLTNKVLTAPTLNGGTWVATDSTFTIADNATPSKLLAFQASGITASTTRTLTAPDASGTIALTAGTTFTTAILTAPTINAATLTGSITGGTVAPTILTIPASTAITTPSITGGSWVRTAQTFIISGFARAGSGVGWIAGGVLADNLGLMGSCPNLVTAGTLVCPVPGLKVGDIITGFHLIGQIESSGGIATLDSDLRVLTSVAADVTDASLGAITQISVTADTAVTSANSTKTLASPNTILATQTFYVLITATTAAATDVALQGIGVIVTQN